MSRLAPLRSLAEHLEALPDRDPDLDLCLSGLARFLAGEAGLEEAMGLRTVAGQRSARTRATMDERDRMLREAAAEFFPGISFDAQADAIHTRWQRYAATGWLRERALDVVPPHRTGTLEERFWTILRARDHVIARRTIRLILAASSGYSLPAP